MIAQSDPLDQPVLVPIGKGILVKPRSSSTDDRVVVGAQHQKVLADEISARLDGRDEARIRVRNAVPWPKIVDADLALVVVEHLQRIAEPGVA